MAEDNLYQYLTLVRKIREFTNTFDDSLAYITKSLFFLFLKNYLFCVVFTNMKKIFEIIHILYKFQKNKWLYQKVFLFT